MQGGHQNSSGHAESRQPLRAAVITIFMSCQPCSSPPPTDRGARRVLVSLFGYAQTDAGRGGPNGGQVVGKKREALPSKSP